MSQPLILTLAGETVQLWPERALGWPAQATLFIADPHLGKTASFRALGIAAPDGTAADLERLDTVLAASAARRLVVLGDLLHARRGVSPSLIATLADWRARHPGLEILLVRGNHDHGAGDPPTEWNILCADEPVALGPFVARHTPAPDPAGHVLAGHVHPGIALRDRNGAGLRVPCFVCGPDQSILPAFGSFTGLEMIPARPGTHRFLVTSDEVMKMRPR